jgi:multidrug efflux pump subunit AcrB
VVRSHKEREIITRTDGGPSVQIEIYKEGDANIVNLAKRVRAALGEFDPDQPEPAVAPRRGGRRGPGRGPGGGPPGMAGPQGLIETLYKGEGTQLKIVADRSLFIESSIKEVRNTAILGGMLAVVVLYLFLRRFKTTAIIAVSIPVSLLITFAPLNLLGVSLNIMSLGGLALGIGMLVDSSIVVLESIYRCREEGDEVEPAALRGTTEVRSAVFASTLTSIAVFFPMVFVEGIAGQAFGDLGLAVVVSLLAALVVALFLIPMLASRRFKSFGSDVAYYEYFGTPRWQTLREWYQEGSGRTRPLRALLFALRFLAGFHLYYIGAAWSALRGTWAGLPLWHRIVNIHNRLLALLLLVPLPYIARWVAPVFRFHLKTVRHVWGELKRDFGASPVWLKIVAAPFWLLRALLILPLPVLLLPWPWMFIFSSRSWARVRADFRGKSRGAKTLIALTIVPLLFLALRVLIGALIEGFGWLFGICWQALLFLVARLAIPALSWLFGSLFAIPLKLTHLTLGGLNRIYPGVLRSALAHPLLVVLIVAGCLWLSWQVVSGMESELLPEVYQGEFTVEVKLPVGTPIEETESVTAPIERAILSEKEHIESLILTVGYDSANSQRSDEGEHTARFKVVLDESGAETEKLVADRLREKFINVPDLEARIVRPVLFSSKTPIEVEVHGYELRKLKQHGDRVMEEMTAMPELADVESSLRSGAPEVQIIYDRDRLTRYGLNIFEVAQLVRDKVKGFEATKFNLKDRRIPIVVRLNMDDRETVDDIRGIIINPGADRPIRLAAVAEVTLGEGPSEVRRIDGRRVAVVSANIAEGSLSGATAKIEDRLRRAIDWPPEMTFLISGQNEEWERSQQSLWIALALSVFLVYVIMAAQFESLIHPLVIMLTIPLAFVGTVVTLKLMGLALSVVVFLGMIMLAGIVVNNAIVLVDYINRLRRRGLERDEAIVTAGKVRLRPILMTTATTVLGLTPMALGIGDGAEIRTPMAIAVISGLLSSTALTLVVIPSIYALADKAKQRLLRVGSEEREASAPLAASDSGVVTP